MLKQKISAVAFILFIAIGANAQVKGNYDYRSESNLNYQQKAIQYVNSSIVTNSIGDLTFSIKGLYNASADSYLAIFTTTQVGKTQMEANQLLQAKIDSIRKNVKSTSSDAEMYVDMISFVPLYEVVKEKKKFSGKTYNEIPMGFELKKNLHFKYSDPAVLEYLVTICAENEIYDLVRVDYFVENMEKKKDEMIAKAELILKKKIERYGSLMGTDFVDKNKFLADGFAVHYPVEQYRTYTAYCSNALNYTQQNNVKTYEKVTSQFYMPRLNKDYDFVVNSSMLEPVVQIEYEIQLRLVQKPVEPVKEIIKEVVKTEVKKEIFFVSPEGKIQKMNF